MNSKFSKLILSIVLLLLFKAVAIAQAPTDNPYHTRYNVNHWTDNLKWKTIVNAVKVKKLVSDQGIVDSAVLAATIKGISNKGGGVLYFPKGKYYFNFNVLMCSGVILRGDDPEKVKNATGEGYRPPTQFIFPQYKPSFTGNGTPNNTAFKRIRGNDEDLDNFGIVNIDVNRAEVMFAAKWNNHVIVYGVRSNNASAPHPTDFFISKQQAWQRLPSRLPKRDNNYIANIAIDVKNDAVIANCRINDEVTDDFNMPNFVTNDGYVFVKDTVKYEFGSHNAMNVQEMDYSNKKDQIEVLDNYVASGKPLGEKILFKSKNQVSKNNVMIDIPTQNLVDFNGGYSRLLQDSVKKLFSDEVYVRNGKDTLHYLLLKPHDYDPKKKYPLVLFFHGIDEGGAGTNPLMHFIYKFTENSVSKDHPSFILVPHLRGKEHEWPAKFGDAGPIENTMDVVKQLKAKYSLDSAKMYVSGLSSGGYAAVQTLEEYPGVFNKAVIMSYVFAPSNNLINKTRNVSFFISGGLYDELLPVVYVQLLVSRLKQAKINVNSYLYETHHLSWINLCDDKNFMAELLK